MMLAGKRIVVTGASHGFGRAVAEACVRNGASVLVCAREAIALERCRLELSACAPTGVGVSAISADVSSQEDVESLAAKAKQDLGAVDGLVNNAGVYGPKGRIEDVSWDEWRRAVEINLYGTVLPCRAILPLLRERPRGKIVNLSGGGATSPLPQISAYAASKAAVVRFTETLAQELHNAAIDVNAVAPGALNTRLLEEVLAAGPGAVGQDFYDRALRQKEDGGAPIEKGVALVLFLLSSASDGITGRLISAIWDPWPRFEQLKAELDGTDIYTLRRIVPGDRGRKWEES
jgi:3-oxoacyl-[acyl-carrier protein] reductase